MLVQGSEHARMTVVVVVVVDWHSNKMSDRVKLFSTQVVKPSATDNSP